MQLWQWLSQPRHIPVLVALVGIVAGVLGGGISQLIAGLFKTRGDTRQLTASQRQFDALEERWKSEQALEREKMLAANLREACFNYLKRMHDLRSLYVEQHRRKETSAVARRQFLAQRQERNDHIDEARIALQLLCPGLDEAVKSADVSLLLLDDFEDCLVDLVHDQRETNYDSHMNHLKDLMRERLVADPA